MSRRWIALYLACLSLSTSPCLVRAQSFGVELHNTLMPASGGMGGVGIAMPQDLTSALNANPAALTQFQGTQFLFGGGWAEPTFNVDQTGSILLLNVDPFSAKSTAPGGAVGNIGVTQDMSELGVPVTFGLGFVTAAAGSVDLRHIPQSNGTNSALTVFELPLAVGVDVTDRLSVGAGVSLGIAFFDGPFVEIGGTTLDYALRGVLGTNYILNEFTTAGLYYQTEQQFRFDNAVRFNDEPPLVQDVRMDLPQNLGFGIANSRLMDGRLLLAVDVLYKLWDEAELYRAIYDNQWVLQLGSQYTVGRLQLRAGYAYAENPLDPNPEANIGGVAPAGGLPGVRYTQGLMAVTSQHRISAGIGIVDVLPGIDTHLMAGGMFRDSEDVGPLTRTSVASYWIGVGLCWRFGRGSYNRTSAPDSFTWGDAGGE